MPKILCEIFSASKFKPLTGAKSHTGTKAFKFSLFEKNLVRGKSREHDNGTISWKNNINSWSLLIN